MMEMVNGGHWTGILCGFDHNLAVAALADLPVFTPDVGYSHHTSIQRFNRCTDNDCVSRGYHSCLTLTPLGSATGWIAVVRCVGAVLKCFCLRRFGHTSFLVLI